MECNGINWEIKCSIGVAVFDSHVRWVYLNLGFVQLFRPWCWSIMGSMFGQMLWGQAKLGVRYLECLARKGCWIVAVFDDRRQVLVQLLFGNAVRDRWKFLSFGSFVQVLGDISSEAWGEIDRGVFSFIFNFLLGGIAHFSLHEKFAYIYYRSLRMVFRYTILRSLSVTR